MMKLAAESGNNICSVLCEAYILHRREVSFEEKELLAIAQNNHWLKPEGSPLHSIGQLLSHYDLMVTRNYDATINDINDALALDNDVIVVVDKEKLYQLEDSEDAPNHAVVVRGVQDENVSLFDPTLADTDVTVSLSSFLDAWKESHNYMIRVLQSIEDYEPRPINLDDISLTDDLLELREAIAENAHDVWATARKKEGWTFGPERDDVNKKHPDLIPYSSLPDSEKEYDRLMALDTIKLVKKLGFEIVKK
jgi:ABC-type bacteriocin/lantibiotic exporter with double-glycine peptidase domain